jgi:hypothetical protein
MKAARLDGIFILDARLDDETLRSLLRDVGPGVRIYGIPVAPDPVFSNRVGGISIILKSDVAGPV